MERPGKKKPAQPGPVAAWFGPLPLGLPVCVFIAGFTAWYYTRESLWAVLRQTIDYPAAAGSFQLAGFLANLARLVPGAWVIGLAFGTGFLALRRTGLPWRGRLEAFCLSFGLGCGLLGTGMLALGMAGLWRPWLVWTLLGLLSLPAVSGILSWRKLAALPQPGPTTAEKLLIGLFCLSALQNLLGCLLPETLYDGLVYHLAVPAHFWMSGGFAAMPHNLFSGIPMLVEMLYSIPVLMRSTQSVHLLHWSLGLAAALTLWSLGARILDSRPAGVFAAVFFYGTPLVAILSWKSSVDLGWTFFQLLAVYCAALRFHRETADRRWLWLSGVFMGLAMGAKYQGWPALAVLTAAAGWFSWKERCAADWWKEPAGLALAALLVLSPWPLKNLILYGNPVYPFFQDLAAAGPGLPDWRALLAEGQARDIASIFSSWSGLRSFLTHPWTLLAEPAHDMGSIGVVFIASLPFIALAAFSDPAVRLLRWVLLLSWLSWSLSSTVPRFFLPGLPLAAALMAAGVWGLCRGRPRAVIIAAAAFALLGNLLWVRVWLRAYDGEAVILGGETPQAYLCMAHNSYFYPPMRAIEYINASLPATAKVLFVGEGRTYYLERPYIAATPFDEHPLRRWIEESADHSALLARFQDAGVTHVLINQPELLRLKKSSLSPFAVPEAKKDLFWEFMKLHLKPVFRWEHNSAFGPESLIVAEVIHPVK